MSICNISVVVASAQAIARVQAAQVASQLGLLEGW